jgi:hypothetical protein
VGLGTLAFVATGWVAGFGALLACALIYAESTGWLTGLPVDLLPVVAAIGFALSGAVGVVGAFTSTGNLVRLWLTGRDGQKRWAVGGLAASVVLLGPAGLALLGTCVAVWAVAQGGVGHGRPLAVRGRTRVARAVARADWADPVAVAVPDDPVERAELARAWTRIALAEHASIPAFARLGCELVARAPDLVERAHRAALDEARHARVAFGLASAYAGSPVGPGALPEAIAPFESGRLADDALLDGVAGEGFSAAVLAECARRVADRELARLLDGIARDEAEHADLARDVLAWAGPARVGGPEESPGTGSRPEAGGLDPATRRRLWAQVRAGIA